MKKQVLLKSLSTGLVGTYPESHLDSDPDLVLVEGDFSCVDCLLPVPTEDEDEDEES